MLLLLLSSAEQLFHWKSNSMPRSKTSEGKKKEYTSIHLLPILPSNYQL
jgi:hypothetical protein